ALTHRPNPVFPTIVPSTMPGEELQFTRLTERLLLPFLRLHSPDLVDICLPESGGGRLMFASLRKRYPQQARQLMDALGSLQAFLAVKMAVVVDADVDVHQSSTVWR